MPAIHPTYVTFYNLKRDPFEITPDPAFWVPTRRHNEALEMLYDGVRQHKGVILMTGEVGTGKTLLVRLLLQRLNRTDVGCAYVFNPRLSVLEFLQYITGDLGLAPSGKNKNELLLILCSYLAQRQRQQLTTVLVIDEAHLLSERLLEETRLLTNIETNTHKLLQIVLVGQPELDTKLDSYKCRQLKQRIALRAQLQPLDMEETRDYIQRRLQLAASNAEVPILFPPETIMSICRWSHGIPRLINSICENALMLASGRQVQAVTADIIAEVASKLRLDASPSSPDEADEGRDLWRAARTLLQIYDRMKGWERMNYPHNLPQECDHEPHP